MDTVYAAGLTYKKHIDDTGEKTDPNGPVIFDKKKHSLIFSNVSVEVKIPSQEMIYKEIALLDKAKANKVRQCFNQFPRMFDYEAELGVLFKQDVTAEDLLGDTLEKKVALFAANDLTLRSVQILGDGEKAKYAFWSAAKSFEHFLPASEPVDVTSFHLNAWPNTSIECYVNGQLRQQARASDMVYSPRHMFQRLLKKLGGQKIPTGTIFITGTSSGTAFKISPLKKFFSQFLLFAPMLKLKLAARGTETSDRYLHGGSEVRVEVEGVGKSLVRIIT